MVDMANEKVSIKIDQILLAISVVAIISIFALLPGPYTAPLVFTLLLLVWGSYYAVFNRSKTSEMCCMMSGMAFGMLSGFFVGAISGLATGDFVIGMIIGAVMGMLFGMPIGHAGGPLSRMEGVMAGPMGGIMGAMTGVMVRFYNVQLFMLFLVLVVIFSVWEMARVVRHEVKHMSRTFVYIGVILSVLALASTFVSTYTAGAGAFAFAGANQLPVQPSLQAGNVQEFTIKMHSTSYEPNYLTVQKDVPVKLTLTADNNAGCTRSFVFPEFRIQKVVAPGGSETVQFTPTKSGTFPFSCSMNMARGTMIVQ